MDDELPGGFGLQLVEATALFDLVVLVVLHALRAEVDPVTDPVSDYAVPAHV